MNLAPAGPHLLDTSAVILMLRHRQVATPEALVSFATLGELATGTFRAADMAREAVRVRNVLAMATAIFPTEQTAIHYGRITAGLQRVGKPIPANDAWNAALALEHDVPLLADDAHFGRVPGLRLIPVSRGG